MKNDVRIKELVIKLKNGNRNHFTELYNLTYAKASAVAAKYLKHKEDQEDVLQEAYVISLNKISNLKKPESYQFWLNQIVATRALNILRKLNPVMFSDMTADEDDADIDFEDESPAFQPEKITDFKATAEAVKEVMNLLPEMQRDALWMHYGQDIPIKDIADAAGVSENTIKSRLKQGRGKLYKMQNEFKKKGIEITGITIAVLLYTLFSRECEVKAAELENQPDYKEKRDNLRKKIDQKTGISEKTKTSDSGSAGNQAGKAFGSAAAKTGLSLGVKIVIAVAIAGIAAGTVAGLYHVKADKNPKKSSASAVSSISITSSPEKEKPDHTDEDDPTTNKTESNKTNSVDKEDAYAVAQNKTNDEKSLQTALAAYKDILNQAPSMASFGGAGTTPSGSYMYSMVTMKQGEGPTLLLAQGEEDSGTYNVKLYYDDTSSGTIYSPSECIYFGVAGGGGYRGSLEMEPDKNGLELLSWGSANPQGYITRYTREGNNLFSQDGGTFNMNDETQPPQGETVNWYDLNDRRIFDSWPEIVKSTGEDGFPAEDGEEKRTGNSSKNNTAENANTSASISGTYKDADGYSHTIVDNGGGSITMDGQFQLKYDPLIGEYTDPTATGGVSIVTSKTQYELHVFGEDETVFYKVD